MIKSLNSMVHKGSQRFTCQVKEKKQYILFKLCELLRTDVNRCTVAKLLNVKCFNKTFSIITINRTITFSLEPAQFLRATHNEL